MSPDEKQGSIFAVLRAAEPPPPPPPAPAPKAAPPAAAPSASAGPATSALAQRLEKLESKLAATGPGPNAEARIALLEKRLQETQERAIASLVTLREREEAQKIAHKELEETLKTVGAQRRMEEVDRQLKTNLEIQRRRVEELETKLMEASSVKVAEETRQAQKAMSEQLEAALADVARLKNAVAHLSEQRRLAEADALSSREELSKLKRTVGLLIEDQVSREELAQLKKTVAALVEEQATRADVSRLRKEVSGLVEQQALQAQERRLAVEEATALRAEVNELRRALAGVGDKQAALADLHALRDGFERTSGELRQALREAAEQQREAIAQEAARRREELDVLAQTIHTARKQLGQDQGEANARFVELEGKLEHLRLRSTAAGVESLSQALEGKLSALAQDLGQFKAEVRTVILTRLLRLENKK